ncbi:MAG TPA: organomercurial lyase [Burkholderiales bacterium]|nr:organomercurial lyase [Burkholderiales bacterium]
MLAAFPELDELDQRLSIALYRELARGEPVAVQMLATRLDAGADEIARRLAQWPALQRDERRRIVGYWGLTIVPSRHRLRIGERDLYAWCAWDTLFLPALLGARAEVQSTCRATGASVRLTVGPDAIDAAPSTELALSFVLPEVQKLRSDVVASFCRHVHFFGSRELAHSYLDPQSSAFVLTLAEAFEAGRLRNRSRYWAIPELN